MNIQKVSLAQKVLQYVYGAVVLVIGLDKLFRTDLIVNWEQYVSPQVASALPFDVGTFLFLMAVIEIAVGVLLLTKFVRIFAYVAAAWLVLISINLLMMGLVDIAARDLVLAVGAVVLAWLTEAVHEPVPVESN